MAMVHFLRAKSSPPHSPPSSRQAGHDENEGRWQELPPGENVG